MHIHHIPGLESVDCPQHSRPVTQKMFLWNYVFLWRLLSYNWNRCSVIRWYNMMTSSNGNIFHVTGHLCGEFTGPGDFPHKGQWRGALMFSLIYAWINDWVNNRKAGDLRCHLGHCYVDVMNYFYLEMVRPLSLCIYTYAYIIAVMSHERRGVSTHRHSNCLFTRGVFWYCVHCL